MKKGASLTGKMALAVLLIVIAIALAIGGYWYISQGTSSGEKRVFYVVAYHWGFVFYDENFNEIPKIEVNKGDTVTIYLFPGVAFAEEAHEEFEHRTLERGVGDLPPGSEELHEKMEEALDQGYFDHGLGIDGYDVNIETNYQAFKGSAESIEDILQTEGQDVLKAHSITFRADKAGYFTIVCTVYCGYGHSSMEIQGGFVVRG
jgi:hypothetical protein